MATYGIFAQGDLLNGVAVERMLAGVATRSFERAADAIGSKRRAQARSTSKSAVSRRFVAGNETGARRAGGPGLSTLEAAVLMIDGVDFAGACCVVALIVTSDGTKVRVGLRLGDTENKAVWPPAGGLVERGLDASGGLLVVIDGAKASLRRAEGVR